jgi:pectinesterase
MRPLLLLLLIFPLQIQPPASAQDVHVRVDPAGPGSTASATDYTSIQQALDHYPSPPPGFRAVIEIVPGRYPERITVTRNHTNVTLLGLGRSPSEVVITNSLNAKQAGGTFLSATADIEGDGFEADNVTFENSAGNTGQAVAIAVRSDRAIFKHCRFLGDQDTLFADYGRQYYVDSTIAGGVDFIFGNATAVFDHDEIREIRPGYLTAQSRTDPAQTTGYVITNSRITSSIPVASPAPSPGAPQSAAPIPTTPPDTAALYNDGVAHSALPGAASPRTSFYLGRPWRPYSRVIVMNTELPADLNPAGWSLWHAGDPVPPSAYYAEFHNTGPGANTSQRAPWSHQLTAAEASQYEPTKFLADAPSGSDHWDPIAAAAKLP